MAPPPTPVDTLAVAGRASSLPGRRALWSSDDTAQIVHLAKGASQESRTGPTLEPTDLLNPDPLPWRRQAYVAAVPTGRQVRRP